MNSILLAAWSSPLSSILASSTVALRKTAPEPLDPVFLDNLGFFIVWSISCIVLLLLVFATFKMRRGSRIFRLIILESARMTTLTQMLADAKNSGEADEYIAMCEAEHIKCALEVNRLWGELGLDTHEMRDAIEGMLETKMEDGDGIS